MGAAASASSLPEQVGKEQAKQWAGDTFDEAAFDAAAKDGFVAKGELLQRATHSTGPYCDDAFPPGAKALGMSQAEVESQGVTWRRASELFGGAPLLPPKLTHGMVVQGHLNDCYVASALALVASTGELSSAADGAPLVQHGDVDGQFVVTLLAGGGQKRVVVVDDRLPVDRSAEPLYTHARDNACLAFSLIEKALAKHYGSFAALNGGSTSEALWDLTGCAVEDVKLDGSGTARGLSPSACASLVRDAVERGDLVACGHIDVQRRGQYAAVCEGGVRMNHAFAVVGASAKEAIVYNPMGADDGYTNGKTDGAGTLRMPWSEFTRSFTRLQVCRRSSQKALRWLRSWGGSSEGGEALAWDAGRTAGGCTTYSTFRRNPMLRLPRGREANAKGTIEAVVGQRDRRGDTGGEALSYPQLGLCVVRLNAGVSWPCVTAEHYEVVAKSAAFWNKREVAAVLEVDLSPCGDDARETYLVPSTYHPGSEGAFWLRLRSDVPLDAAAWVGVAAPPSAVWRGASARNTVRLGVEGATAGRLCVFVRQTVDEGQETRAVDQRVPLGVYLLDGDKVLSAAQFCKAGEVSVAFELDEETAASPHLAIAPSTFAADKGAPLEVEVMAPDAPSALLKLSASSGADPRTLSAAASKGAGGGNAPTPAPAKKAGKKKEKRTATETLSMGGARKGIGGLMADYGDLGL